MNMLAKYSIAYKGLSTGKHHFDFSVDDCFFDAFEDSEIKKGHADISVDLDKQSHLLTLDFRINGEVAVTCDRCLEEFMMPIDYTGRLVVRFSETRDECDGEVMWVSPAETEINLAQYIYESICLSLPYQRVHPTDENGKSGCDPDMLARFKIVTEEEFEKIVHDEETNSFQEELEALKQKMEE